MAAAAAAAGAVTVDVVLVVAGTPAVGVWEDERVRTGVSGGDWLPAAADSGGAFATTRATAWQKEKEGWSQTCLQGLHPSQRSGKPAKARNDQHIQLRLRGTFSPALRRTQPHVGDTRQAPWGNRGPRPCPQAAHPRLGWRAATVCSPKLELGKHLRKTRPH